MALTKVGKKPGIYQNQLADGDIVYYYSFKHEGKKHNVKVGKKSEGITPTFAYNKKVERLNLLRLGEDPKAGQKKTEVVTFDEVWDFYINNKGMEEKTREDRKGRYKKHMAEYFSKEVTVDNLKKFRANKEITLENPEKKDRLSPVSVDMLMAMTGTAINYWNNKQRRLRGDGKPSRAEVVNPLPNLRADDTDDRTKKQRKATKVKREKYLSKEEVLMLKEAVADKPELNLFVHLALTTGGRLGTILSIQKKHIKGDEITLINEKVGEGAYNGFLDDETLGLLQPILKKLKTNDKIFQLEKRQIQRRLQWILDKLFNDGLDTKDSVHRAVVHSLRHTFASHLVINGVSLAQVQKLMDHKDIATTMIYAHLGKEGGRQAVKGLWA